MQSFENTRDLLSVSGNQKSGAIKQEEAKEALKGLDANNVDSAKAIISTLKSGEMHPALKKLVAKAETEMAEDKPAAAPQPPRRRPRM